MEEPTPERYRVGYFGISDVVPANRRPRNVRYLVGEFRFSILDSTYPT